MSVKDNGSFKKHLHEVKKRYHTATVQVGFLEKATYPDGTPVAYIAAVQEYGATINKPARQSEIYRKTRKDATWTKKTGSKFVKKSKANLITPVSIPAHTIIIPSRPFFRNAIADNRKDWKKKYALLLKKNNFDVATKTLAEIIVGDIKKSITTLQNPPLAKSTIKRKGFSKPLIDTGHMLNSVDYRIIKHGS